LRPSKWQLLLRPQLVEPTLSQTQFTVSHHKSLRFIKITRKKACNVFVLKGLFLSGFPITISHADRIPPVRTTCPVYQRILNWSTVITRGEEYKSWSPSARSSLQHPLLLPQHPVMTHPMCYYLIIYVTKVKLSRNKSWRLKTVRWSVRPPSYLDVRHNWGTIVVSSTRRPNFTAKVIPWYSFTLEAEWTPGLLIADRRNRAIENFQGFYRGSNPEPLVCGAIHQPNALFISVIRNRRS